MNIYLLLVESLLDSLVRYAMVLLCLLHLLTSLIQVIWWLALVTFLYVPPPAPLWTYNLATFMVSWLIQLRVFLHSLNVSIVFFFFFFFFLAIRPFLHASVAFRETRVDLVILNSKKSEIYFHSLSVLHVTYTLYWIYGNT